jgi:hypothetical protein
LIDHQMIIKLHEVLHYQSKRKKYIYKYFFYFEIFYIYLRVQYHDYKNNTLSTIRSLSNYNSLIGNIFDLTGE